MEIKNYRPSELEPRKLSDDEINHPLQVIHQFFDYAHLPVIREKTWELLKTAVTGNFCAELDRKERVGLIYFFEQLEKLIEAAHILHQQKRKNKQQKEEAS